MILSTWKQIAGFALLFGALTALSGYAAENAIPATGPDRLAKLVLDENGLEVEYLGQTSNSVTVQVAEAPSAFFARDSSATRQAQRNVIVPAAVSSVEVVPTVLKAETITSPREGSFLRLWGKRPRPVLPPTVTISNVTVPAISQTQATVTWTTDLASTSLVAYGPTPAYGSTTSNSAPGTSHTLNLTGLTCSTLYNYEVSSTDNLNRTISSPNFTLTTSACVIGDAWWDTQFHFRIPVTVTTGNYERYNKPVETPVNFTTLLTQSGTGGVSFPVSSIRVVEINGGGAVVDPTVAFQFDQDPGFDAVTNAAGNLVWIMTGTTAASATRKYYVYFDSSPKTAPSFPVSVSLTDNVDWASQSSYKITTSRATYYYHKQGAGFASLIDQNGIDWIQYNTTFGSAGTFRGIPNTVNPEGYFHPGNTSSTSSVINQGPIKLTIASATTDDSWRCQWEIFPEYARFTMLKIGHPFWFLYEGTPNGNFQPTTQFWVKSNGAITDLNTRFEDESLPTPKWVYFGDPGVNRVLYYAQKEDTENLFDIYYNLDDNMTVFGFGRTDNPVSKFLTQLPAHFTIGFAESKDFPAVSNVVYSSYKDLTVTFGTANSLP